ncbi:Phage integrase family protein [Actinokineospora alba]|uniref:Phage integrase family protein n=2 Tax=Actinokineospora alba TaxID=504798 RepID=A0A1H0VBA9_9PSEU|nr:Phage integrase family protein [Actinokineospora alba]SDP75498.1 Phage integrase family protein [Actinokineospora alba]
MRKLDGGTVAYDTARLRRNTLRETLDFAVAEKELLDANPLSQIKVKKTTTVVRKVDRRCVANAIQIRTVLNEVRSIGRTGRKLVAFFGLMYLTGARPEEAVNVRLSDCKLPPRAWNQAAGAWEVKEWGDIVFSGARPEVGAEWTDSGQANEERGLKHREESDDRTAPCPPELALLIYEHVDEFGTAPDGRLFVAERGGRISSSTYGRIWALAREAAFTAEVAASPLIKRPYDLRHSCLSMHLNAGIEPTRVAKWGGNSLRVLLEVYADCTDAGEQAARARLGVALNNATENFGTHSAQTPDDGR